MKNFYIVQIGALENNGNYNEEIYAKNLSLCNDYINNVLMKFSVEKPVPYPTTKLISFSMEDVNEAELKKLNPTLIKNFHKEGSPEYLELLNSINYKPSTPPPSVKVNYTPPPVPKEVVAEEIKPKGSVVPKMARRKK